MSRPFGVAFVVSPLFVAAAGARSRMAAPGAWKPWTFTVVASARKDRAATAAEVKAVEAQLVARHAILQRAPGVPPLRQRADFQEESHASLKAEAPLEADLSPTGQGTMAKVVAVGRAIEDAGAWLTDQSPAVQPNRAFFDTSLPRSAPQVIVVPHVARQVDGRRTHPRRPAVRPTGCCCGPWTSRHFSTG